MALQSDNRILGLSSTLTSAKVHQDQVFFTVEVKVEQQSARGGCITSTKKWKRDGKTVKHAVPCMTTSLSKMEQMLENGCSWSRNKHIYSLISLSDTRLVSLRSFPNIVEAGFPLARHKLSKLIWYWAQSHAALI